MLVLCQLCFYDFLWYTILMQKILVSISALVLAGLMSLWVVAAQMQDYGVYQNFQIFYEKGGDETLFTDWINISASRKDNEPITRFSMLLSPYFDVIYEDKNTLAEFQKNLTKPEWIVLQNNPEVSTAWGRYWNNHWAELLQDPSEKAAKIREMWYTQNNIGYDSAREMEIQSIAGVLSDGKFSLGQTLLYNFIDRVDPQKNTESFALHFREIIQEYPILVDEKIIMAYDITEKKRLEMVNMILYYYSNAPQQVYLFEEIIPSVMTDVTDVQKQKLKDILWYIQSNGGDIQTKNANDKVQNSLKETQEKRAKIQSESVDLDRFTTVDSLYNFLKKEKIMGSLKNISLQKNTWKITGFTYENVSITGIFDPLLQIFTEISVDNNQYKNVSKKHIPSILSKHTTKDLLPSVPKQPDMPYMLIKKKLVRDIFLSMGFRVDVHNIQYVTDDEYIVQDMVLQGQYMMDFEYIISEDTLRNIIATSGRKTHSVSTLSRSGLLLWIYDSFL